jgi:hypothetical protein
LPQEARDYLLAVMVLEKLDQLPGLPEDAGGDQTVLIEGASIIKDGEIGIYTPSPIGQISGGIRDKVLPLLSVNAPGGIDV